LDEPVFASPSVYLWAPPPYAGDVAIAQLRDSRHKRTEHMHIFVVPRLASYLWIRHLYRASDMVITVPVGSPGWPSAMHEPLLISLVFPFIRTDPWQLRSTPKLLAMGRELHKMWEENPLGAGPFLRKLCRFCRNLRNMPLHMVSRLLYFAPKTKVPCGRAG